jgi:P27 family predicted phage terminase small subunit
MARYGRRPKPTVVEAAEGNPGKQAVNAFEPQFDAVIPPCPAFLSLVAKRKWREIAPMLHRSRLLTEADQIALANLCQAYATMAAAQQQLNAKGLLIKTKQGIPRANPAFKIVMESMDRVNRLCQEFGLTPSARSRLRIDKKDKATDPFDDAIFNRGAELLVLPKPN